MENVRHFRQDFFKSEDYGRFRTFLGAMRQIVQDAEQKRLNILKGDIDARLLKTPNPKLRALLIAAQEKLLPPERNFVVAEEYINQFVVGRDNPALLDAAGSDDAFAEFISGATFDPLYALCRRHDGGSLRNTGIVEYVETKLRQKSIPTQYQESSKALLRGMPSSPREATNHSVISKLLCEIGFAAGAGEVISSNDPTLTHLSISVVPNAKDSTEYAHPVAMMGTLLPEKLDVVCLFGRMQARDIVDRVCALELKNTAVVLLNGALDLASRRQMAERFHVDKSGHNPFLLIDWVLMLYLALHPRTERMSLFLRCSLPYTSKYEPFVDSGKVPDEMFIGRKRELGDILDHNGPVILYGGRQLGKTALMDRAKSLAHHPAKKEYSALISVQACYCEEAFTAQICGAIIEQGLNVGRFSTMKELCDCLERMYQERAWKKLLLLMDESDKAMESFRGLWPAYAPLLPLVDLKRNTSNAFKFVLGGLHNVCRTAREPNTIFGQLGTPLRIKPLDFPDALTLLGRPLRYMGFRVDSGRLEHLLVNTCFFPGIIHYVGRCLSINLATRYSEYYRAANNNPPYEMTDQQLGSIMSTEAFNEEINKRIRWTLEADQRYYMLARCIACLNYDQPEDNQKGYSPTQIMEYAELLDIRLLQGHSEEMCALLLMEMVDMGILIQPTTQPRPGTFRLRQRRFLDIIGTSTEQIEKEIQVAEGRIKP